jgi:predicted DNA-binding transcriptional regulator YafY
MIEIDHLLRLRDAMRDPERWTCRIVYRGIAGDVTERVVSPIRFDGSRVLALCLGAEEPRWFRMASLESVVLVEAVSVTMPEAIEQEREKRFSSATQDR